MTENELYIRNIVFVVFAGIWVDICSNAVSEWFQMCKNVISVPLVMVGIS